MFYSVETLIFITLNGCFSCPRWVNFLGVQLSCSFLKCVKIKHFTYTSVLASSTFWVWKCKISQFLRLGWLSIRIYMKTSMNTHLLPCETFREIHGWKAKKFSVELEMAARKASINSSYSHTKIWWANDTPLCRSFSLSVHIKAIRDLEKCHITA